MIVWGEERDLMGDDTHLTTAVVREGVTHTTEDSKTTRTGAEEGLVSQLSASSRGLPGSRTACRSSPQQPVGGARCDRPRGPAVLPAALLAEQHWQRVRLSV